MKKIILLLMFMVSFAAKALVCPASLTCDYDSGVCDTPSGWNLSIFNASDSFLGSQVIKLSAISAIKPSMYIDQQIYVIKQDAHLDDYLLRCKYGYGKAGSAIMLEIFSHTLTGSNWVFSGFGKTMASCSDITDPTACIGE